MNDTAAASGDPGDFVAKWRGAWPEWALAEGFVPAAQRSRAEAWEALQFEWQEAAWGGSDARPGEAKLAWWAEELDGWSRGRRRHPLGSILQREPAPWRELAAELPGLGASRSTPRDLAAAREAVAPACRAASEAEHVLFGGAVHADALVAAWLHARLARHPAGVAHDATGPEAWRRGLLSTWPAGTGVAHRGVLLALARSRLARGDAAAPLPPWAAVWAAWRGARR